MTQKQSPGNFSSSRETRASPIPPTADSGDPLRFSVVRVVCLGGEDHPPGAEGLFDIPLSGRDHQQA